MPIFSLSAKTSNKIEEPALVRSMFDTEALTVCAFLLFRYGSEFIRNPAHRRDRNHTPDCFKRYADDWRSQNLRALLIRHPHIDKILDGKKTWEIRGSRTLVRETIGLVASGSGTVIGVCDVNDCVGPLTPEQFRKNAKRAGMRPSEAELGYYRQTYAWVLEKPRLLKKPVPYEHPPGAIIWVTLDETVEREILKQLIGRHSG